jgi:hypothetical protein
MKAFSGKQTVWNEETGYHVDVNHGGMDLRDYFAAKAMQALINDEKLKSTIIEMNEHISKVIPKLAYEYADSMMKAREV